MSLITWYGISAVQIKTADKYIVIDPYLTKNPLGSVDLNDVAADIILVTHGARDHFGDAVELAAKTGAMLVGPVDVITCAIEKGIPQEQTKKMVPGGLRNVCGIDIKALHVQHLSVTKWDGKVFSGVPLSYIVTLEEGLKVYHAGDTALHGDFKLFGEVYKPDIGLMPIGMFPGAITEMNPLEAAIATDWMGFTYSIPIHYDPVSQKDYVPWYKKEVKTRNNNIQVESLEAGVQYKIGVNNLKKIFIEKAER